MKFYLLLTLLISFSVLSFGEKPNIVFILTDDQRYDEIAAIGNFPWMQTPNLDKMVNEGIHFENAFVTTSLCGPSRASFLTGVYANQHGVVVNEYLDYNKALPTFATLLNDAGYKTAYFGKWHQAMHNRPRPGFDKWMVFWGQGKYYNDALLTETGENFFIPEGKYLTDQLNELAVDYIEENAKSSKPFLLYLSHKALHEPFTPPQRHKDLYSEVEIPSQDNPNDNMAKKPEYIRSMAVKNRARGGGIAPIHWKIPDKMRTATAVDEGVGMIFEKLKEKKLLKNTIVIFAGDNGYFVSEHGGLHDKRKAYEESIRIPLIMWNPFEKQPRKIDALTLNIDLAPYICDIAGIKIPGHMNGESWQPILDGKSAGRDGFLYEYYREDHYRPTGGFGGTPTILAYREKDWKYVTYPEENFMSELYDLSNDPDELYNLIDHPGFASKRKSLAVKLEDILEEMSYIAPPRIRGN
jgi:N-acetylglucosamine-6-sulfatase